MSWNVRGGLLMFRFFKGELQIFLAHPTSYPGYNQEDEWVLPKGGKKQGESLLMAAVREFHEEVGVQAGGPFIDLDTVQQRNGKVVHFWAFQGDYNENLPLRSQFIDMEWPPGSGRYKRMPEFDEVAFFPVKEARKRLRKTHRPLLERLQVELKLIPPPLPPPSEPLP